MNFISQEPPDTFDVAGFEAIEWLEANCRHLRGESHRPTDVFDSIEPEIERLIREENSVSFHEQIDDYHRQFFWGKITKIKRRLGSVEVTLEIDPDDCVYSTPDDDRADA